mmetsp:Transcript_14709/g.21616  ORF Transcript_14709/g.21616 Transcript_14709/m.21616 type:complete len:766 (+) Transcript_14709:66-2363(+)
MVVDSNNIIIPYSYFNQFSEPLYCHSYVGDGYDGWYAISSSDKCNDFCFWESIVPSHDDWYSSENTANPHVATSIVTANWRCALGVGEDDDVTWSNVRSKLTPIGHFGPTFEYLRCARHAEILRDGGSKFANSLVFWSLALVFAVLCFFAEVFMVWRRRGYVDYGIVEDSDTHQSATVSLVVDRNEANGNGASSSDEGIELCLETNKSQEGDEPTVVSNAPTTETAMLDEVPVGSPNKYRPVTKVIILITVNAALVCIFTLSIFSIVDLDGNNLSDLAASFTPACSDPKDVCHIGNHDIDLPSRSASERNENIDKPFSYLVASDSQLDWFVGEHSGLGVRNIPIPCEKSDNCGVCTKKFGEYTNRQMKLSIEKFTLYKKDNSSTKSSERRDDVVQPPSKTLIMNGDLTSYFHPGERESYENVFHHIEGLEHYFPTLGNHDYDHGSTTAYKMDKWFGAGSCNAKRSIGYMRGGFCGKIPNFDPKRITRYDAASLSYSWEEGRYHFVHLHYYPAYENQGLGLKSSLLWLERDLTLAHAQNLTSIIFVHAAAGLGHSAEKAILGKNVKAIFSGHNHRCFMGKCEGIRQIRESEFNSTNFSSSILPYAEKCISGGMGVCGANAEANGMSLFYLSHVTGTDWEMPDIKLYHIQRTKSSDDLCPDASPTYINETDNTLLCVRGRPLSSEFSSSATNSSSKENEEQIPIFWSGSSSFETFLKVDFYPDRIVVNGMTAEAGKEGMRYIDTHDIPNAVYPYHNETDLDEVIISI